MKPLIVLLIILIIGSFAPIFSQNSLYTSNGTIFGGSKADKAYSVIQTIDSGYLLVGTTESFGDGSEDIWAVKTDAQFNMEWNRTYGQKLNDGAVCAVQSLDGCNVLAGYTDTLFNGDDAWLIKIDQEGNLLWNKTYGGTGIDLVSSIIRTDDGGFALAGFTESFGIGYHNAWFVRVDSDGNMLWNRTYGGSKFDEVRSILQVNDDGYILAGRTGSYSSSMQNFWLIKTNSAGDLLWNRTYESRANEEVKIVIPIIDGYLLIGTKSLSTDSSDILIVQTDFKGNLIWNKVIDGLANNSTVSSAVQALDGGFILAGYSCSSINGYEAWLVKVDSQGDLVWNKTFGGAGSDLALSVVQINSGYVVTGYSNSFGPGLDNFWLFKIDEKGDLVSSLLVENVSQRDILPLFDFRYRDILPNNLSLLLENNYPFIAGQFHITSKEPIKTAELKVVLSYFKTNTSGIFQEERKYTLIKGNDGYAANITVESALSPIDDWLQAYVTTKILADSKFNITSIANGLGNQGNSWSDIGKIYLNACIVDVEGFYMNGSQFQVLAPYFLKLTNVYQKTADLLTESEHLFVLSHDPIQLTLLENSDHINPDARTYNITKYGNIHLIFVEHPSGSYTLTIEKVRIDYSFVAGRNIGNNFEVLTVSDKASQNNAKYFYKVNLNSSEPIIAFMEEKLPMPNYVAYFALPLVLGVFLFCVFYSIKRSSKTKSK